MLSHCPNEYWPQLVLLLDYRRQLSSDANSHQQLLSFLTTAYSLSEWAVFVHYEIAFILTWHTKVTIRSIYIQNNNNNYNN